MKPLFKWVGGKRLRIQYMSFPTYAEYREPFCGGAAVYLHLMPKHGWINDADPNVINFFSCCADENLARKLYAALRANCMKPYRSLDEQKQEISLINAFSLIQPSVENALRFLRLLHWGPMANLYKSGIMDYNKSNPRALKAFPSLNTAKNIAKLYQHMSSGSTRVTCGDFTEVISAKGKDVFIFIDPPYVIEEGRERMNKHYGGLDAMSINNRLLKILQATEHKFLLTVEDNEIFDFRKKYAWAKVEEVPIKYTARITRDKQALELFIRNY